MIGREGPGDPYLAALQAALAGEHAAVWAAGRAAADLGGESRRTALRQLDDHRTARDRLRRTVASLGEAPAEAAPAYLEPFPVVDPRAARRLMAHVNSGLAAAYADLAAATPRAGRRPAAIASAEAAVRAIRWGGGPEAFPGEA
jgi:hypothetical protein